MPGKKRLTMVSLEHVPMGLNFSSKNELAVRDDSLIHEMAKTI